MLQSHTATVDAEQQLVLLVVLHFDAEVSQE